MVMKAVKDKVIIKVLPVSDKVAGTSIFMADESKDKEETRGEVVSVCDNWSELQDTPLNVKDNIIFLEGAGKKDEWKEDGNKFRVISHKEVLIKL